MEKRVTKRERFNVLREMAVAANKPELVDFIDHELALLEKKNAADRKPTAKAVENGSLREAIVSVMERGKLYSLSELAAAVPALNGSTPQRMSGLVKPLTEGDAPALVKTIDKRKAYFSLA